MDFYSKSGTKYCFDDTIGIAYPLNPILEKIRTGDVTNIDQDLSSINETDWNYNKKFLEKLKKIQLKEIVNSQKKFNASDDSALKKFIFRHGLLQMTLGVTEECNLACKYCVFSDFYKYTRSPSNERMDFATAKSALDHYMALLDEGDKYNPTRTTAIGFYGGEPLLNFDVIKKSVLYLTDEYPERKHTFTITTNATLLTEKISDFLVEHDFSIAVSLDGPQEEHDRNRVYKNGKGTFSDIMKNIQKLMDMNYEKCHSLAIFDIKSDLFKFHEFFNRPEIPKLSNISLPSFGAGCSYYDQFDQDDFTNFDKEEERAFNWYLQNISEFPKRISFFDLLFGISSNKTIYNPPSLLDRKNLFLPYTGACTPGRKIFVDPRGNFHLCERVNSSFPIGDVHNGLDYEKIRTVLNNYTESLDRCESCNTQRLCDKCYASLAADGNFTKTSASCNKLERNLCNSLSKAFTIGERSPESLEWLSYDYYKWMMKISVTMGD